MENVKFSFNVSKSWDYFLCYLFIGDLLSVDLVTFLSNCKAIDEHWLLHPVLLTKSINSLTDVLGSCLCKLFPVCFMSN